MSGLGDLPLSGFGDSNDNAERMSEEAGRDTIATIGPDKYEDNCVNANVLKDDTLTMQSASVAACYVHCLPDEIWVHIFDMVERSTDLSSCSKTCLNWKRILSDRSPFEIKFDEIFPMVSPFLNRHQLLECRLVNALWKNTVDESASKRPEVLPLNSVKPLSGPFGNHPQQWFLDTHPLKRAKPQNFNTVALNPHWNAFFQTSKVQRFYDKFSTWNAEAGQGQGQPEVTTVNPFISRSIFLYVFTKPDGNSTFMLNRTRALEFLTRFGRHIWSIILGGLWWDQVTNREESLVLALHDSLVELPNLKYLDFGFTVEQNPSNFDESLLYQKLWENPLPLLKKLETLRFAPSIVLLPVQLYLLEQHASQLKRVDLFEDEHRDKPWPRRSSSEIEFPVLKELNMSMDGVTTALNILPIFETAPLEYLVIGVKMEVDEEKMKRLMEMIYSLFGGTLRVLYLEMNHQMYSKAAPFSPPAEVQMPRNLESLTLSGCSNLSLNSLLCLADSLKYLTLEVQDGNLPVYRHPDEIIDVRELITLYIPTTFGVYVSNVWDLLPNLKELVFHVLWAKRLVFTREQWKVNKNEYGFLFQ